MSARNGSVFVGTKPRLTNGCWTVLPKIFDYSLLRAKYFEEKIICIGRFCQTIRKTCQESGLLMDDQKNEIN